MGSKMAITMNPTNAPTTRIMAGAISETKVLVRARIDRKSTRLNSSHSQISYAVFCLKKKNHDQSHSHRAMLQPHHQKHHHRPPPHDTTQYLPKLPSRHLANTDTPYCDHNL